MPLGRPAKGSPAGSRKNRCDGLSLICDELFAVYFDLKRPSPLYAFHNASVHLTTILVASDQQKGPLPGSPESPIAWALNLAETTISDKGGFTLNLHRLMLAYLYRTKVFAGGHSLKRSWGLLFRSEFPQKTPHDVPPKMTRVRHAFTTKCKAF
jgi:hypothetical protein